MLTRTLVTRLLLSFVLGIINFTNQFVFAEEDITLYTTNTRVSIAPGESVDYVVDVINNSQGTRNCNLSIYGVPRTWNYILKSGAYNIQQISILPGEKKVVSLKIEVPVNVNKGNYPIKINAGSSSLPLVINVSKQGTYTTEFTTDQANMQGHTKATFSFRTKLVNRTAEKQLYSLTGKIPKGWKVTFKPNNSPATSVEIDPNSFKNINVDVVPPQNASAGAYKIVVGALNNLTSADLELEVVISGTYDILLTTPNGLVSTKITAGDEKTTELIVSNTGSMDLTDVKLIASKPSGWEVVFEPEKIDLLEPGKSASISATIKPDKKAISGDYVTNMSARVPQVSSQLSFRIAVKTPMIWGWTGILIVLLSFGVIIYLFRKFGRR